MKGKREKGLTKNIWTITEDAHEAIISLGTFEKVQEKIFSKSNSIKNSRKENKNAKDDTVFRGKLYCGICKRKMSVHRQKSGNKTVFLF